MPNIASAQLLAPKNWEEFEDICFELWREILNDPNTQKNGRKGQKQHGVDIWSKSEQYNGYVGIQCKGKDSHLNSTLKQEEIEEEIRKAEQFVPELKHFIIATTSSRDAKLQEVGRVINEELVGQQRFSFRIYFWEDIVVELNKYPHIVMKYWKEFYIQNNTTGTAQADFSHIITDTNPPSAVKTNWHDKSVVTTDFRDILNPVIMEKYNDDIDESRDLILENKPNEALSRLKKIKERIWSTAEPYLKFRVLTNMGAAYTRLNNFREAAKYFIEALQYNPSDEKALTNCAHGYLILENYEQAEKYSLEALGKNPLNAGSYSIYLQSIDYLKNIGELEKLIPSEFEDSSEVFYSMGYLCRRNKDNPKAEAYYQKAYELDNEQNIEIINSYATIVLENTILSNPIIFTVSPTDSESKRVKLCLGMFAFVWNELKEEELKKVKIGVLVNRCIAKRILRDFDGALSDITETILIAGEEPGYILTKALIQIDLRNRNGGIKELEKICLNKETPESDLILAELMHQDGNTPKAIEILKERIKDQLPEELIVGYLEALISYNLELKFDNEAEKYINELVTMNPNSALTYIARAELAHFKGNLKERNTMLGLAKENAQNVKENLIVAEKHYEWRHYKEAALVYQTFVNLENNTVYTGKYIYALYRSGEFGPAIKLCQKLRLKYGHLPIITEIEISILSEIDNLKDSIQLSEEFLKYYPNNLEIQIRKIFLCLRIRDFDSVDEFVNSIDIKKYLKLPFQYIVKLSLLCHERNQSLKSIDILYEARRQYTRSPEAHFAYISTFFSREKEIDKILAPSIIEVDCAVKIKNELGTETWYIIENRPIEDLKDGEVNISQAIARSLLYKKKGDDFVVDGGRKAKYKVIEVQSKYVHALQVSLTIYPQEFPERKDIQGLTLSSNPENPGGLNLDEFFNEIDAFVVHQKNCENLYKSGSLTIGQLSVCSNQNIFHVINGLMSNKELGVRCSDGSFLESKQALHDLRSAKFLTVDLVSLIMINELGIIKPLGSRFEKLFIPRSVIDLINMTISYKRGIESKGFMTLGKEDGKYVRQEFSAEQVEESIKYYEGLITFITTYLSPEPCNAALTLNIATKRKLDSFYMPQFNEAALLAKEKSSLLYSDDYAFRNFARAEYGVNGAWTQIMLFDLLNNGLITSGQYEELVVKLAASNFFHTKISAFTLIKSLEISGWNSSPPFWEVAEVLSGRHSDVDSAISVVVEYLKISKDSLITPDRKRNIFFVLLDKLTLSRNHTLVVEKLLLSLNSTFLLLPLYFDELKADISAWQSSKVKIYGS